FNTNPTPSAITPHSQHYYTCLCCKQKTISCVYLADTKHAPDYTQCIIFKNYLLHRNCISKLWDIKLTIKPQTSPLTLNQKSVLIAMKIAKMTPKQKILLFKTIFLKPSTSKPTSN